MHGSATSDLPLIHHLLNTAAAAAAAAAPWPESLYLVSLPRFPPFNNTISRLLRFSCPFRRHYNLNPSPCLSLSAHHPRHRGMRCLLLLQTVPQPDPLPRIPHPARASNPSAQVPSAQEPLAPHAATPQLRRHSPGSSRVPRARGRSGPPDCTAFCSRPGSLWGPTAEDRIAPAASVRGRRARRRRAGSARATRTAGASGASVPRGQWVTCLRSVGDGGERGVLTR